MNEPNHDLLALPGDCLSEIPPEQKQREAEQRGISADDPGEPVPDDAEVIG